MSHMLGEFAVSLPEMQQCVTKRGRARVTSDGKHKPMDKQYGIGLCLVLLYAISPQLCQILKPNDAAAVCRQRLIPRRRVRPVYATWCTEEPISDIDIQDNDIKAVQNN
ncbi:hypothetical protein CFAM422_011455 [Trichoderma lentiforme]|uniref:Uncharacterized protein n=1 Tax=Trichoderma lentiforme TaxID=1567552 RepID=A0A9P4X6H1_9HYPO|nr:hypothetical protein CFAM422_011455 [Trichoderma lentiforme]